MRIDWLPLFRKLGFSRFNPFGRNTKPRRNRRNSSLACEFLEDRAMLEGSGLLPILNLPPVGAADTFNVLQGNTLNSLTSVLSNDSDPNNDLLNAQLVLGPLHGTLNLHSDGTFTYIPDPSFTGTDLFSYLPNDGTLSGLIPALATINVLPAALNLPPVGTPDTFDVSANITAHLPSVLSNDTDPNSDELNAILAVGPLHGTITLNADGTFTYLPNTDFVGTDVFSYLPNDGTLSGLVPTLTTLNVLPSSVNLPPLGTNDIYSVISNTTSQLSSVLANDSDPNNDALTAQLVVGPLHGTVNLNPDGTFSYLPNLGFVGTDLFTYLPLDGTLSGLLPITVNLNVLPTSLNHAPVANNDTFSTQEDAILNLSLGTFLDGILANDTDADGNLLLANLVTTTQHGTLTILPTGTFIYTPLPNFTGTDTFTYQATDGVSTSNVATATITVLPLNDAPTAVNDSYSTAINSTLTVSSLSGVLANDFDIDSPALTASLVSTTTHGTLTLNADGSFTYIPAAGFTGVDVFTYHVSDGTATSITATVSITVTNAPNTAPVANGDAYNATEDTALTIVAASGVLVNDTDVNGNPLTAHIVSQPLHGTVSLAADGSFVYTPNANFNGSDNFSYQANDGSANSGVATVSITVAAVNDAPTGTADSYSIIEDTALTVNGASGVLANDTDVDGNTLTAAVLTTTSHGILALNPDGSFTYTPNANFNGSDSFTYRVSDGTTQSAAITVTLSVGATNDAPIANNDTYAASGVLNVPSGTGLLSNDTDADGDTLVAAVVTNPTHGTLVLNSNGSFTYTPSSNYSGTDSFTYRVNDGTSNSNTATVTLNVSLSNTAPVAANDTYAVNEDGVLTVPVATGVLSNDTDADGNTLTAVVVSIPTHGSVTLNADGSFTYTPAADFTGTDSFTYRANDGTTNGNTATVTLNVGQQNEAPIVTTSPGKQTVKGHKRIVIDPAVNLTDADSTNFNGGKLVVRVQSGVGPKDKISLRHGGANRGRVNAKRNQIRVGKTVVGSFTGGLNGSPIEITFNQNATIDRVRMVMQNLTLQGSHSTAGARIIGFQVTDETGLTSNIDTKEVDVT